MDDEVERFDTGRTAGGYALRAAWGRTRFRALSAAGAHQVAYAADGAIRCVVRGVLHELAPDGLLTGPPWSLAEPDAVVRLATHAPRAVIGRASEMAVVDLDTREVIARRLWRSNSSWLPISADGTRVVCGTRVLDVDDDVELASIEGTVLALSGDGAIALTSIAVPLDVRGKKRLVRTSGGVVREIDAAEPSDWSLDATGEYLAWIEQRFSASAWHTGRGTESPDWEDDRRVVIARTTGDAPAHRFPIAANGPIHFARTREGPRAIVRTPRGIALLDPETGKQRTIPAQATEILAVSPDGRKACVRGLEAVEIDLDAGAVLAPSAPSETVAVAWSRAGDRALVLRADGALRLWDVHDWRCERVVANLAANARPGFTDDDHVLTSERTGAVTCRTLTGDVVWQQMLAPMAAWGAGFGLDSVDAPIAQGADVVVTSSWSRAGPLRVDLERDVEWFVIQTVLDRATGAVRTIHETPSRAAVDPWDGFRAIRDAPPWSPTLGAPANVWPSPDRRTLIVSTTTEQLLRLDRIG